MRRASGDYTLSDFDGSTSHVDVSDGSLVVFGQGKLRRFTADFVPANDLVLDKFLSNFAFVDGSLLIHGYDTSENPNPQFATWVELSDVYVEGSSTVAVDPANGSAWIWDKSMGALREVGPDGAELRVLSFDGSNGAGPGVDAVVGIDPGPPEGPRRVWLGWSDDTAGGLQYFDLTDAGGERRCVCRRSGHGGFHGALRDDRALALAPVTTSFSGPTQITSLAPGWVFRPSTNATVPLSFPVPNPSIAIADVPRQACWFLPDHQQDFSAESAFVPIDGISPSTTFSTTVAGQVRIFTGGLIDHWYNGISGSQGRMFFMTRNSFQAGFPTRVLSIYEPTLSTAPLLGPSLSLTFPGPYDECESVAYDPFYRQFLIGMGDVTLPSSVEPTILWVSSTGFSESAQMEGLYSPSLSGP